MHSPFSALISALSVGEQAEQRHDEPHPRSDRKLHLSSIPCPAPFFTADPQSSGAPRQGETPARLSLHSRGLSGHPTAHPAGEGSRLEVPRMFLPPETCPSCSQSRHKAWSHPLKRTEGHGEPLQHPHGHLPLLWDSPCLEKVNRRKIKKPFRKRLMHIV